MPSDLCPVCHRRQFESRFQLYGHSVCKKCHYDFASRRQVAWILDMVTIRLIPIVAIALLGAMATGPRSDDFVAVVAVMVFYASFLLIFFKDGFSGYSPGKYLMGVRVLDAKSGEPVGPMASLKRNICLLIPFVAFFIAFQLKRGDRLGDSWANTKVVWWKFAACKPFRPNDTQPLGEARGPSAISPGAA